MILMTIATDANQSHLNLLALAFSLPFTTGLSMFPAAVLSVTIKQETPIFLLEMTDGMVSWLGSVVLCLSPLFGLPFW